MKELNIKSAVIKELFRIVCFLIYYILLIGLGFVLVIGSFLIARSLIIAAFTESVDIIARISYVIGGIGFFFMAVMLGIYLIKPLFSFKKDRNENRVEVFESDCPDLFAMIRELANQTGCKMPKHVYLTPDVNACVFYDKNFWSIFFPIKKNLEIGLGLFDGTSIDEVKAIIAHEFGHFSQKSTKIGSTVYVVNTILYDLIYAEDFWDRFLNKWCASGESFGLFTRKLTNVIKGLTFHVYRFVHKGNLKLSRCLEYDADNISCQCVGHDVFVSALCKVNSLTEIDNLYKRLLKMLIDEDKMVSNYFTGKTTVARANPYKSKAVLRYDKPLTEPIRLFEIESRVRVEDVWSSHPLLADRLDNAKSQHVVSKMSDKPISAWDLIPDVVLERVSNNYIFLIRRYANKNLEVISDKQLKEWTKKQFKHTFVDERLAPYFGMDNIIPFFHIEKVTDIPSESPFTRKNQLTIIKYRSLLKDLNVLDQVKNGRIDAHKVVFDNCVYSKKNLPIETLEKELELVCEQAVKVYSDILAYIVNLCDDEDQKVAYKYGFLAISYSQWYLKKEILPRLFEYRDALLNRLNQTKKEEEACRYIQEYEDLLKLRISSIDLDWLSNTFINEDYIKELKRFLEQKHTFKFSVDSDVLDMMLNIPDNILGMTNSLEESGLNIVIDITEKQLDKQKLKQT